ncbi:MAG: MATE family efflux transporter [Gammaproteobacteria bacterium]|nr:MATE family efflux transporter [Gammaproteobacteria bacterium]
MPNNQIAKIFFEANHSLKLAFPLIISELIYGLNGFITTFFVARLGRDALAANILVWVTYSALILFFVGVLCSVSVLVAQSFGAKDNLGIKIATQQGIVLAFLSTLPMLLIMLFAPKVLILTGQDPEIISLATTYFHSLAWSLLPLNLLIVLEHFLLGIAKTRLVMIMSMLIVPLQIAFVYVFMFGKFGTPKLGLSGIGYGITFAYSIAVIVIGLYIYLAKECRGYQIFSKFWCINSKFAFEIIRIGSPIGGMFSIELAMFSAITLMMGKFGKDALAAHQIAFQCVGFVINIIFGLAQATSIRIGHAVGANNRAVLKLSVYINIFIGLIFMLVFAVIYLGFPTKIIALDVDIHNPGQRMLISYAVNFLAAAAILQFCDCWRLQFVSALRGLKDTKIPMLISVVGFWLVAFPLAYILGFIYHFGGIGIWSGLIMGLVTCAIILTFRFHYLVKRVDLEALVTKV